MSEKDAETTEVSTTVPEETAPVVEGMHQQGTCADSAQVANTMGIQTPPLKGPETPELTGSPTTDRRRHVENQKKRRTRGPCVLHPCARRHPLQSLSQLDLFQAQIRIRGQTSSRNLGAKT